MVVQMTRKLKRTGRKINLDIASLLELRNPRYSRSLLTWEEGVGL
jgi:hypothetical protein